MPEENKKMPEGNMPDRKAMRKAGFKMGICMALTLSFVLSFVGTFTSGHFTFPNFLISFVLSTIVSIIIGLIVPIGKVMTTASRKAGLKPGSVGARALESLICDLIYTPLITFLMVFYAYSHAVQNGAPEGMLLKMYVTSLFICFFTAYILVFIIQPVYMKAFYGKLINDR